MFPSAEFHLYDSRPFTIEQTERIKINQRDIEIDDLFREPLVNSVNYLISDYSAHDGETALAEELARENMVIKSQESQKKILDVLCL
jgi:hypothetical protein